MREPCQLAHFDDHNDPLTMLSRGQKVAENIREEAAVDLLLEPGDVSLHHTLIAHSSGPNRSDDWRIGIGISYIPTSVRHIGPTRLSATLVRGTDRFNHFDHESCAPGRTRCCRACRPCGLAVPLSESGVGDRGDTTNPLICKSKERVPFSG